MSFALMLPVAVLPRKSSPFNKQKAAINYEKTITQCIC